MCTHMHACDYPYSYLYVIRLTHVDKPPCMGSDLSRVLGGGWVDCRPFACVNNHAYHIMRATWLGKVCVPVHTVLTIY